MAARQKEKKVNSSRYGRSSVENRSYKKKKKKKRKTPEKKKKKKKKIPKKTKPK